MPDRRPQPAVERHREVYHNLAMKQVYLAPDPINAQLVKDYLASFGIEAIIQGSLLWGGQGDLPVNAYPTVWVVNDTDFERARQLALEWERPRANAPGWDCPACGERLPGQFTECWNCGYLKD